jgi:hypothetical protein
MQTISRTILALAVAQILSFGMAPSSHAASIITALEIGGDVVLTAAGGASFNLTGLSLASFATRFSFIAPDSGSFATGANSGVDQYNGSISGPTQFGAGMTALRTTGSGPYAGIFGNGAPVLFVPEDYVSGSLLAQSTSVYAGETFASLGITPGTYEWILPADSVTLNIGAPVPIPAAAWLFGSALGLLAWTRRKAT